MEQDYSFQAPRERRSSCFLLICHNQSVIHHCNDSKEGSRLILMQPCRRRTTGATQLYCNQFTVTVILPIWVKVIFVIHSCKEEQNSLINIYYFKKALLQCKLNKLSFVTVRLYKKKNICMCFSLMLKL